MKEHESDSVKADDGRSMLEEIAESVDETGFEYEVRTEGLFVDSGGDGTLVTSEAVDEETDDGRKVEEIIRVVAELTPSKEFYPRELLKLNSLCAMGAVLDEEGSKNLKVVSKLTVYEGFEETRALHVHMATFAALFNIISFFGGGIAAGIPSSESAWSETEFKAAAEILRGAGFAAFESPTGMGVEIPIAPEMLPGDFMPGSSLLQFDTREIHPNLGAGLFYKLVLPMKFSEQQLIDISRALNLWEFSAIDVPPMMGAWNGVLQHNSLTHVGFWPNNMYWPGIVSNLSVWMAHRNELAYEIIDSLMSVEEDR